MITFSLMLSGVQGLQEFDFLCGPKRKFWGNLRNFFCSYNVRSVTQRNPLHRLFPAPTVGYIGLQYLPVFVYFRQKLLTDDCSRNEDSIFCCTG